jgi:hypothetical protein
METMYVQRRHCRVKVLFAVTGVSVVLTMGALTVAPRSDDAVTSTASPSGAPVATITKTASPQAPETPFAEPTFIAIPCPKRATYPCTS